MEVQILKFLSKDIDISGCTGMFFSPTVPRECLYFQCLRVGQNVSWRLALIPSGVHQTPSLRALTEGAIIFPSPWWPVSPGRGFTT